MSEADGCPVSVEGMDLLLRTMTPENAVTVASLVAWGQDPANMAGLVADAHQRLRQMDDLLHVEVDPGLAPEYRALAVAARLHAELENVGPSGVEFAESLTAVLSVLERWEGAIGPRRRAFLDAAYLLVLDLRAHGLKEEARASTLPEDFFSEGGDGEEA